MLDPLIGADTNSHNDIEFFLTKVYARIKNASYRVAVIYGDEQTVALMWNQIAEFPNAHMWVVPFPGEFHLMVHLTHGIYRLFEKLLMPFASFLGRDKITVEFLSKYWHKQEDFLVMLVEGILKWLVQVKNVPTGLTAQELLSRVTNNKTTYFYLHFLFHFGLFYWELRQQIRMGNTTAVTYGWKYSWPLFHATNKYQYAKLCIIASYCQHFSHDAIKNVLENRLCNLSGWAGHFMGTDMVCEKVRSEK